MILTTTRGFRRSRRLKGLLVFVFSMGAGSLAYSCGQPTSSATLPTPSRAASATASAFTSPAAPPQGGPVPVQLLGDWYLFLPPDRFAAITSFSCPSQPTSANCFFQLTLSATTYRQSFTARGGRQSAGQGDVVVNNQEIDFFNGALCGLQLPDGIGRYSWSIVSGVLSFTLMSDPCGRSEILTAQGWSLTH